MTENGKTVVRWKAAVAIVFALVCTSAFSEPLIYSGDHDYIVPEPMADKMTELADQASWSFFPDLRRYVDADDDGTLDFVAIALGAKGGFGAQIRYRLEDGGQLGSWYWCVITDESGEKVFEQFNP